MKLDDVFNEYPDDDELIWQFVDRYDFEYTEFEVTSESISIYATPEFLDLYKTKAQPWQKKLVQDKIKNIDQVKDIPIIVHQDIVVDGNHRLMAMYLSGIKKINIIEV